MSLLSHQSRRSAAILAISVFALILIATWSAKHLLRPSVHVRGASRTDGRLAASRMASAYGKLPISFEINQGQTDHSVQFLARGSGYSLFLAPGEAVLALHSAHRNGDRSPASSRSKVRSAIDAQTSHSTSIVRLRLIGANASASVAGLEQLPGKSNYFIGNDPARWHTDVPTYAKVRYHNIYPGIDLVYYGNQEGRLEHDFVVSPGADPKAIVLSMHDRRGTIAPENGGLTLHTKVGDLTLRNPVVYQEISGQRKTIPATYTIDGNSQIRFHLGNYDSNVPLVIDPVLVYSGVFGGSGDDQGVAIAVDNAGNAYIAGITQSTNFPVADAFQSHGYNAEETAFVAKINAAGTALVYSTYLACANAECETFGNGIAVDSTGRAYVVGAVGPDPGFSGDFAGTSLFPVKNAYQYVSGGSWDAFLTAFSPAGNSLIYSTYLGGAGSDSGDAIALDASGNAYITGTTLNNGTVFPTLHSITAQGDIFVAKFNRAGALQYSSILTAAPAHPTSIAVDGSGSAYITGYTTSTTYPTVKPAFQYTCQACPSPNGFVTKLSPSGESLVHSTYLGGPKENEGNAIAVDTSGQVYVAGYTGAGFPVAGNAFQKSFGGGSFDGYIAKLNAAGSGLIYSTYLGGRGDEWIYGMALDQYRQVYVAGQTTSPNFPLKAPIQGFTGSTNSNQTQAFVTTLSNTGGSLVYYSTYFGQAGQVMPSGPTVDKALSVYLTGTTAPGPVPITPGAIDKVGGSSDVFVSKLVIEDDLALALSASPSPVKHEGTLTYTIAVTSKGPDFATNVRVTDALPAGTTFVSDSGGGGSCTAPAVGHSGTLQCTLAQLNKGNTWNVKLTVRVNAAAGSTIKNTASTISNTQDFVSSNNTASVTTKVD